MRRASALVGVTVLVNKFVVIKPILIFRLMSVLTKTKLRQLVKETILKERVKSLPHNPRFLKELETAFPNLVWDHNSDGNYTADLTPNMQALALTITVADDGGVYSVWLDEGDSLVEDDRGADLKKTVRGCVSRGVKQIKDEVLADLRSAMTIIR